AKRHRAEWRFRAYGIGAISIAAGILLFLLVSIAINSIPAFTHHYVKLTIAVSPADIADNNYNAPLRLALRDMFPSVTARRDKRKLYNLLSVGAEDVVRAHTNTTPQTTPQILALTIPVSDDVDLLLKDIISRDVPQSQRVVSDLELGWIDELKSKNLITSQFAWHFFTNGDSREAELAGLRGALVGSLLTMLVTLCLSFPIGVAAAIYLQELAPQNRLTRLIEVNINNLAAVPSIVFGLLGLAVFINFFGLPRSAPLVGGLVLALMTLPTIIIATRASLAAVPSSIRQAALGVGASRLQVVLHHVLPLALPGILTGTIIGLAQAAGETAPLLMVGMMAFIVDTPASIGDRATVLPAQIFMWANNPERAFIAKTSAGIIVLLTFLLAMNAVAIYLRKKFEKRW
ncbi:MAG: phosphate ABC transporter permease PstA, partial [Alphaproteobacteria bacterium]|nr:phosphate ABC transporter permease PstA [Alphaproteobacteria bacterium]